MELETTLVEVNSFSDCLKSRGYLDGYVTPKDYDSVFVNPSELQMYSYACRECAKTNQVVDDSQYGEVVFPLFESKQQFSDTDILAIDILLNGTPPKDEVYVSDMDMFVRNLPSTSSLTRPLYSCVRDCINGSGPFSGSNGSGAGGYGCLQEQVKNDADCRGLYCGWGPCPQPGQNPNFDACMAKVEQDYSNCEFKCRGRCKKWKSYPIGTEPIISISDTSTGGAGTIQNLTSDTVGRGRQVCPVIMWANQTPQIDRNIRYDSYGRAINYY